MFLCDDGLLQRSHQRTECGGYSSIIEKRAFVQHLVSLLRIILNVGNSKCFFEVFGFLVYNLVYIYCWVVLDNSMPVENEHAHVLGAANDYLLQT